MPDCKAWAGTSSLFQCFAHPETTPQSPLNHHLFLKIQQLPGIIAGTSGSSSRSILADFDDTRWIRPFTGGPTASVVACIHAECMEFPSLVGTFWGQKMKDQRDKRDKREKERKI
jgi:hypothetical protein